MTNNARARLGRRLWSARLTLHPKSTMTKDAMARHSEGLRGNVPTRNLIHMARGGGIKS